VSAARCKWPGGGIAAEHGLPFLVISAGTRNHFAPDLGLNRDDKQDAAPRSARHARPDAVVRVARPKVPSGVPDRL